MAGLQPPAPGIDPNEDEQQQLKMAMLALQQPQPQVVQDPVAGMGQTPAVPPVSATPQTPQPDVTLAHADINDQPASKWVSDAQGQLDRFQNRPMWKKMLGPGLIAGAAALGAHTYGGRQLQENAQQSIHDLNAATQTRQQSLMNQLQQARGQQMSEYELDQRNRQQDLITAANNQNRRLLTEAVVGGRRDVQSLKNEGGLDIQSSKNEGALDTQGLKNTGALDVANVKGKFDLQKAQINAQASLNRFLAGQRGMYDRQQLGFEHTDTKPTADESRRADLAEAMSGYASMLKDIASRRPELFGKGQGRLTRLRQLVGTDDPDVAALQMIKEQLGITQMGAHSLRSAQAIAPIADSMVNSFNNDAATTIATADLAIKGVQQFINGPVRPTVYDAPAGVPPPPNAGPVGSKGKTLLKSVTTTTPATQGAYTALTVPVGQTYNGHIYLGGDRSKPESWKTAPKTAGAQ